MVKLTRKKENIKCYFTFIHLAKLVPPSVRNKDVGNGGLDTLLVKLEVGASTSQYACPRNIMRVRTRRHYMCAYKETLCVCVQGNMMRMCTRKH